MQYHFNASYIFLINNMAKNLRLAQLNAQLAI